MWDKFRDNIVGLRYREDSAPPLETFKLWDDDERNLSCYYAPFDHVNEQARIILVGITPGRTQMNRSLNAAAKAAAEGADIADAIREVKRIGSFSGKMRANIVNTLDRLGYAKLLDIATTSELFGRRDDLVHFCSLLRYPVFINGKDYAGTPKILKVAQLKGLLEDKFVAELKNIRPDAALVPLGDTVGEVVDRLALAGKIPQQVRRFNGRLVCPPHPSGSNAEAIQLILRPELPSRQEYEQSTYAKYLATGTWRRKGREPQSELTYKTIRRSRWESARFIRQAYGVA